LFLFWPLLVRENVPSALQSKCACTLDRFDQELGTILPLLYNFEHALVYEMIHIIALR